MEGAVGIFEFGGELACFQDTPADLSGKVDNGGEHATRVLLRVDEADLLAEA